MLETDYWDEIWARTPCGPPNNFAVRAFKLIQSRNLKTLLDLGCATGRDSVYFSKKDLQVTAVDFSECAINQLPQQSSHLTLCVADIRNLDFPEDSFEVVYAHLSLHYFDDKTTDDIILKIHKILKNGGLLFIKCKSTGDVLYGKGEKVGEDMYLNGHVRHFFSKEYMAEKLKDFRIISLRKSTSNYHRHKSSFIGATAEK